MGEILVPPSEPDVPCVTQMQSTAALRKQQPLVRGCPGATAPTPASWPQSPHLGRRLEVAAWFPHRVVARVPGSLGGHAPPSIPHLSTFATPHLQAAFLGSQAPLHPLPPCTLHPASRAPALSTLPLISCSQLLPPGYESSGSGALLWPSCVPSAWRGMGAQQALG